MNVRVGLHERWARIALIGVLAVGWVMVAIGSVLDQRAVLAVGAVVAAVASVAVAKAMLELDVGLRRAERKGARQPLPTIAKDVDKLARAMTKIETRATTTRGRLEALNGRTSSIDKRVGALDARIKTEIGATVRALSGEGHQQLKRSINQQQLDELSTTWLPILDLEIEPQGVRYLERRVVAVENMCVGRLAASSADAVFRMLVARSIRSAHVEALEVGVLYGINAALLWDTSGVTSESFCQTLVDLYDGYYDASTADRFTGLVVKEGITTENLRRVGGRPRDSARVIKGSSRDPGVIAEVGDRAYDVVFIDGDHSFGGVAADFGAFAPMTKPGGFVIVDDYGAPSWPDIARFVDGLDDDRFEFLGVFHQTALVRRR